MGSLRVVAAGTAARDRVTHVTAAVTVTVTAARPAAGRQSGVTETAHAGERGSSSRVAGREARVVTWHTGVAGLDISFPMVMLADQTKTNKNKKGGVPENRINWGVAGHVDQCSTPSCFRN